MATTRAKKKEMLEKLSDIVKKAQSIALVSFSGLTVANAITLRRAFRAEASGYFVSKKTLIRKALSEAGLSGTLPDLPGEVAIAWSDDVLAPLRLTAEWGKKLDGRLKLIGGVFEKTFQNEKEAMALATIPPMQTLRGMFVNIVNSPIQRFVIALNEVAKTKTSA